MSLNTLFENMSRWNVLIFAQITIIWIYFQFQWPDVRIGH